MSVSSTSGVGGLTAFQPLQQSNESKGPAEEASESAAEKAQEASAQTEQAPTEAHRGQKVNTSA